MKYETRPFIMLNDLEEMYEYSDENLTMLERGHRIPVPLCIDTIRLGYPVIDYSEGDHKDFPVLDNDPVRTLTGLLLEINRIINVECDNGHNYAPHDKSDYCIEVIKIEDNIANVFVGS